MNADQMLAAVKAEGITKIVQESGWRTAGRDSATGKTFGPVHGVLIHHTAGTGAGQLTAIKNGRSDLPGPLAHAFLAKDATLHLVSVHRANHAGLAARNAMNAIMNEAATHPKPSASSGTVDGNDMLYGIEIENKGDGKDPYPKAQYDAAVRWATAICRFHGWSANSIGGHKETSVEGKVDPSFNMNTFRDDVDELLSVKPGTAPKPPAKPATPPKETAPVATLNDADVKKILSLDGVIGAPSLSATKATNPYWTLASHIETITETVLQLRADVAALAKRLEASE